MRLTCPNCGAQYEVPGEVIPTEGRDVQCSNCGDTWFQDHTETPETGLDDLPDPVDPQRQQTHEPDPTPDTSALRAALSGREAAADAPEPEPELQQQDIDPSVADILREEAERETQLRATEAAETLESQPDLGLDNLPGDETSSRAREARKRMAQMRGQKPQEPAGDPGTRRGLLPDIEEINSTLRASGSNVPSTTSVSPQRPDKQAGRRGFSRGFSLIVVVGVVAWLVYANAPKIAQNVPQADPFISSYVALVDQARLWLDTQLGALVPK